MTPADRPTPTRVLLADNHLLVLQATRRVLERHPDIRVIAQATDGRTALGQALCLQPDVALIDLRIKGLVNGIEVARRISQALPATSVLLFSEFDKLDYARAILRSGASGYLAKTVAGTELADAVRRADRGEIVLGPAIMRDLPRLMRRCRRAPTEGDAPVGVRQGPVGVEIHAEH